MAQQQPSFSGVFGLSCAWKLMVFHNSLGKLGWKIMITRSPTAGVLKLWVATQFLVVCTQVLPGDILGYTAADEVGCRGKKIEKHQPRELCSCVGSKTLVFMGLLICLPRLSFPPPQTEPQGSIGLVCSILVGCQCSGLIKFVLWNF